MHIGRKNLVSNLYLTSKLSSLPAVAGTITRWRLRHFRQRVIAPY